MRVAIYLRVSTKDQTVGQQRKALKDYAKMRGWKVAYELSDEGMSAKKIDRPGYLKILEIARKRKVDGVLVFKFDRWARSLRQLINSLDEFKALGVEFISFTENIDTTTPAGRAMFGMIALFAEFERDMISEATRDRMAALKRMGMKMGRPKSVDDERIFKYVREHPGTGQRPAARALGIPLSSVSRVMREIHSLKKAFGTKKPTLKGVQKGVPQKA